jgi:hypothetical protein
MFLCAAGDFPDSQEQYDASALPLQNHVSFMEQAEEVQYALTNADSECLATLQPSTASKVCCCSAL